MKDNLSREGRETIMDDGEGGRAELNFDEKSFLFEWLVENNKTLTRKNKELLVENLKLRSRMEELEKDQLRRPDDGPSQPLVPAAPPRGGILAGETGRLIPVVPFHRYRPLPGRQ